VSRNETRHRFFLLSRESLFDPEEIGAFVVIQTARDGWPALRKD